MSGGSHNYICWKIDEELVGRMHDAELDMLMADVAELVHDLEWSDSGDIDEDDYFDSVKRFKQKWLKSNAVDRLEQIITEQVDALRKEMTSMLEPYIDDHA